MKIKEFFERIKFWRNADRLGPDMPATYIKLFFPSSMRKTCRRMFKRFGEGADFRPGALAFGCSKISIGNRVVIRPGTMLFADVRPGGAEIVIEDDVLIGGGTHLYVGNHCFDNPNIPIIDQGYYSSKQITLKKGCWVAANVTILPGVTIGQNAVVGAGSVVTKDVQDKVVVAGNPAKVIKQIG